MYSFNLSSRSLRRSTIQHLQKFSSAVIPSKFFSLFCDVSVFSILWTRLDFSRYLLWPHSSLRSRERLFESFATFCKLNTELDFIDFDRWKTRNNLLVSVKIVKRIYGSESEQDSSDLFIFNIKHCKLIYIYVAAHELEGNSNHVDVLPQSIYIVRMHIMLY